MPWSIDQGVHVCGSQGWLDRQVVQSFVLLNLLGGTCVTDIEKLESDAGLCAMVRRGEFADMAPSLRRATQRRFRSGRSRTFPAATQMYTFLESCHDEAQEQMRVAKTAFIPASNDALASLDGLNTHLLESVQRLRPCEEATLDGDATIVSSETQTALFCYKGYRGWQPYNVWWDEQRMVLRSEFRDGNVPAGFEVTRVMKEAVACLPPGVKRVYTRQDTAAYQTDFLAWCEREREHPEYGRILFTVSADVTASLRSAVLAAQTWKPLRAKRNGRASGPEREWAELVFVPEAQALLSDIREPFRYIAIRERMDDQLTLGEVDNQLPLPFPVATMNNVRYKVHAIVTNRREDDAEELIRWHNGRCGRSEEAHAVMKYDFTGGRLPSAKFGANAAWWALMILSMNFAMAFKRLILGDPWVGKRMKALRFELITTPGRIVQHARQYCMRVSWRVQEWLAQLRAAVATLSPQSA
jgi:hypothetical protein